MGNNLCLFVRSATDLCNDNKNYSAHYLEINNVHGYLQFMLVYLTSFNSFQPLPVRALTDEEYNTLFEAVLQNAENLDIESKGYSNFEHTTHLRMAKEKKNP